MQSSRRFGLRGRSMLKTEREKWEEANKASVPSQNTPDLAPHPDYFATALRWYNIAETDREKHKLTRTAAIQMAVSREYPELYDAVWDQLFSEEREALFLALVDARQRGVASPAPRTLVGAFPWDDSPQGHSYWKTTHLRINR